MARVLVGMGINKVRLTGGEPLLRKGVVDFVRELAKLKPQAKGSSRDSRFVSGHRFSDAANAADHAPALAAAADRARPFANTDPLDIALTTNGHLLADMAQPLKDAGLTRVTVSMDAVDPDRFTRITRVPGGYDHVLAGIRAARRAGLWPLKVNCVLMRGFNEDQIIPFGMFAREEGVTVRFIEFMPLEEDRTWAPSTVVTLDEILTRMAEYRPLVEIPACALRNRAPLPLRRRSRRNRHHRPRLAPVLRTLQPHPHHQRRQNSHLPLLRLGPRPARPNAPRRHRRRVGGIHPRRSREKRRTSPHRRTRLRPRLKNHGPHRRIIRFILCHPERGVARA